MVVISFVAWAFFTSEIPDTKMHVYFLDVGQGDGILIKTPENHQILVDGGPDNTVIAELSEVLPFFDKELDMLVLSHPHDDHVAGLIDVLKRYEVKTVLMSGAVFGSAVYEEFLNAVDAEGTQVFVANAENDFKFGEVFLDVIYPFESFAGQSFDNVNNSSVALKMAYGGKFLLLTGDLEKEGEENLVTSGEDLKADIYKAGHHGSKTSSGAVFMEKVRPEIAVISLGKDNSYGHPNKEALKNIKGSGVKEIYRTDLNGRVEIIF